MEVPPPQEFDSRAYLAHTLLSMYQRTPKMQRLEAIDEILGQHGVEHDSRDKLLKVLDTALLNWQKHELEIARLLLRCPVTSLEKEEDQLRLKFGE